MKKILILFFVLTIILSVCGCNQAEHPFLAYQNEDFEAKGTLSVNGEKYSVLLTKKTDVYKLEYLSPDTLKGVSIEKNNDGFFYKVGSITLPISEQANVSARLPSFFNLTKQELVSTRADTVNGAKVQLANFKKDDIDINIVLSKQTDLPLRFEATANGSNIIFNISEFKIAP
ncbi:MAG: hypothetical protein IJ292_00035 [Clostridia bacterium]|nr:hypothetical protein [Clostridia bacterium]